MRTVYKSVINRSYSVNSIHVYDVARYRWHASGTKDVPMLPAALLYFASLRCASQFAT